MITPLFFSDIWERNAREAEMATTRSLQLSVMATGERMSNVMVPILEFELMPSNIKVHM